MPVWLATLLALVWAAKPVLVPLLVALLLAQLLMPLMGRLEAVLPSGLAALLATLMAVAVLACVLAILSNQAGALGDELPNMQRRLADMLGGIMKHTSQSIGMTRSSQAMLVSKAIESALGASGTVVASLLSVTFTTLGGTAIVIVLTFLMLHERDHFRRHLLLLAARRDRPAVAAVVEQIVDVSQRYVAGLLLVIGIVGLLDALGCWLVDAPFPFLFGLFGACAVLVPYVGILVVAPACMLLALAATGSVADAMATLGVFACVHLFEGNILSPCFVGHRVDLNPLVTIIAVLVGGALWGPIGMLLFIPLAGICKLTFDNVPATAELGALLGPTRRGGGMEGVSAWLKNQTKKTRERLNGGRPRLWSDRPR